MIPTKQQVKDFFRTVFKVVPGGPAVGTPGANRSAGALLALDLLADFAQEIAGGYRIFKYLYNPPAGPAPYAYPLTTADKDSYVRIDTAGNSTVYLPALTAADLPARLAIAPVSAAGSGHVTTVNGPQLLGPAGNLQTLLGGQVGEFVGVQLGNNVGWAKVSQAGTDLATVDLLALTTTQMDEVLALPYTDCDADPAASPAWSRPGHQFDALSNGHNCHFYCTRGTYDPAAAAGSTGAGPAWHYTVKQA